MEKYFDILRDEQVQRYLGGGVPLFDKEPHISNWLNNINGRLLKNKNVFTWCVEEKSTGEVAGRVENAASIHVLEKNGYEKEGACNSKINIS